MIRRGATQTHYFNLPYRVEDIVALYINYVQQGQMILEKTLEDAEFTEDYGICKVRISQEDSLKFLGYTIPNSDLVRVQARVLLNDGSAYTSNIINERVYDVLRDGVISGGEE